MILYIIFDVFAPGHTEITVYVIGRKWMSATLVVGENMNIFEVILVTVGSVARSGRAGRKRAELSGLRVYDIGQRVSPTSDEAGLGNLIP